MSDPFNDGVMEERYDRLEEKYHALRDVILGLLADAEDLPVLPDELTINGNYCEQEEVTKVAAFVKSSLELDDYINEMMARCEKALEEGDEE